MKGFNMVGEGRGQRKKKDEEGEKSARDWSEREEKTVIPNKQ